MKARQILEKNNEFTEKPARPYSTNFDCKMNENDKRKVTPWQNNEFTGKSAKPYATHFDCKMNENDKRKVIP